jgi:hypothetical protein
MANRAGFSDDERLLGIAHEQVVADDGDDDDACLLSLDHTELADADFNLVAVARQQQQPDVSRDAMVRCRLPPHAPQLCCPASACANAALLCAERAPSRNVMTSAYRVHGVQGNDTESSGYLQALSSMGMDGRVGLTDL